MQAIGQMIVAAAWIWGIILAKGGWSTFFAIFFPPWSWYLVLEKLITHYGLI